MPSRDSFITGPTRAEIRAADAKAKAVEKAKKAKAAAASAARIAKLNTKKDELMQRLTLKTSARPRGTYSGGGGPPGWGGSGGCGGSSGGCR